MSNYRSRLRGAGQGIFSAEDLALLREVHRSVLSKLWALNGCEVAEAVEKSISIRVADALLGLAESGVSDPEILEKRTLRSFAASPRP